MRTLRNAIGVAVAIALLISSSAAVAATRPRVVAALGQAKVQGIDVIVEVLAVVFPGEDPQDVARAALAAQGARPFESAKLGSDGFTVTGLVWDGVPVIQNYNFENEPIDGEAALGNTHATWVGVDTSSFDINFGRPTDRCPSLVRQCQGPQFFDALNDVAWLRLDARTLAVTWFGTSTNDTSEADMALNTRFDWADDGVSDIDVETVFLHENGHVVGLGHSDVDGAVMEPFYAGPRRTLHDDDEEGATYLYDTSTTGSVLGNVTDGAAVPIADALVVLEGTTLMDTTDSIGDYEIPDVPDPVTYDVTASKDGFESETDRLSVDGVKVDVNFALTATGGGGEGDVCALPLLPAGESCVDDGECCSNKCKGKPGFETCK